MHGRAAMPSGYGQFTLLEVLKKPPLLAVDDSSVTDGGPIGFLLWM
jgi:hypothetical protein